MSFESVGGAKRAFLRGTGVAKMKGENKAFGGKYEELIKITELL